MVGNGAPGSIAGLPGRLAQLARAARLQRAGRGFESLSAHYPAAVRYRPLSRATTGAMASMASACTTQ